MDIPTVDTLLFVRPTESIAVFTQQIGRGLCLVDGKDKCVIIDFIGNYRNADRKLRVFYPELLKGDRLVLKEEHIIPFTNSVVRYDVSVIDLLCFFKENYDRYQRIIQEDKEFKTSLVINNLSPSANETYTLIIRSFFIQSKGDAPLEVKGEWEVNLK